jgi:hypothetical protein
MGRRIARSHNCLFVKCPSLPTLRPLADAFGARNISADIVANGAVPTIFQLRPWGRMNAGRRQTPRTKRTVKNRAPAFRLRAPEIVGRGSWSQTGQAPVKGSRSREKVSVEVVTPIAVGDNELGPFVIAATAVQGPQPPR